MRNLSLFSFLFFVSLVSAQTKSVKIDSLNQLLSHENLSPKERIDTYEALGAEYENSYRALESANAYRQAIDLRKEAGSEEKLTELLFRFASMSMYAGDYENAVNALEETLNRIQQEGKDETLKARTLMQLGVVNFFQQKWDEALFFYEQALKSAEKLKNEEGISIAYNNIANIYQKKGERDQASEYYERALKIQRERADSAAMCNCLMNIASNYLEQGQLNKVKQPLNEALDIAYKVGDNEIIALSHMHQSVLYAREGDMKTAMEELQKSENIAEKSGYDQVRFEILQTASSLYEEAGDYHQSLKYQRQANALSDSLLKQQMLEKTHEFEVRYKTQEKEQELALRSQSLRIARLLYISFALIMVLLSVIIGYLIYHSKQRKKQNKQLAELNTTKDKLLSIISHDLKNPILAQKIAVDTMIDDVEKYDKNTVEKLKVFREATESQLSLLQNLLNWASLQTGKMVLNPIAFNVSEVTSKVIDLYHVSAQNKDIRLVVDIPHECVIYADKQMISTVIRNLLNNAIKFTKPGNEINVSVCCNEDLARVSIADKGIGMAQQQIDNLLKHGKNVSLEDTRGERSSGLGLIVCKDLLEINNSRLEIESQEHKGTTISFKLPKT